MGMERNMAGDERTGNSEYTGPQLHLGFIYWGVSPGSGEMSTIGIQSWNWERVPAEATASAWEGPLISLKGPLLDGQEPFSLGDLIQMHGFIHFLHTFSWVTLIFSLPSLSPGSQTLYGFWLYLLEWSILSYPPSNSASSPPPVSSLPPFIKWHHHPPINLC